MSKQTFDTVTRNIRAVETKSRLAISNAEAVINKTRRMRYITIAANQELFNELGACLQEANQLHDVVVANAHLVNENIARRSRRNVLSVRDSLLETANRLLELCSPQVPATTYNPDAAFAKIGEALSRNGLLVEEPNRTQVSVSERQVIHVATFRLEQLTLSIVVSIEAGPLKNLGQASDIITVSVWQDRLPPVWDTSYHDAAGVTVSVGNPKGHNLGRYTKQTDSALIDYVSSVMGRDVIIPNGSSPPKARNTPAERTNRYSTNLGHPAKEGNAKNDFVQRKDIIRSSIEAMTRGRQGEVILKLNPQAVNKSTMARYVLGLLQAMTKADLAGAVSFNRAGYYQLVFPIPDHIIPILDGTL
jgi:hypothetical protein